MTHDNLCPCVPRNMFQAPHERWIAVRESFCQCDLIRKARADERLNALVIVGESQTLQDAAAAILMAEPPYLVEPSTAP
jgi:hypothetical protein